MRNRTKEKGKKVLIATAVCMMLIACAFAIKTPKSSLPVSSPKSATSSLNTNIPQMAESNVSSGVLQEVATQKTIISNEIVDFGKSAIGGCSSSSAVAVNPQSMDSMEAIHQLVYSELPFMAVSISPAGILPENLLEDIQNMLRKSFPDCNIVEAWFGEFSHGKVRQLR